MSDYMDKLIHVGYTNKYQLDYAKDQEGYFYCDPDNECNIPLYMLTVHSFRAHNSVVVETHEAMQARIVELESLIKEADDYLNTNKLTTICNGSILHAAFKEALKDEKGSQCLK